jgi:maleamate amidohydrolase
MRYWEKIIPEQDRSIYEKAQFGSKSAWGKKPCLLIVDVMWSFVGSKPMDVMQAIEEYPTACGKVGWEAMEQIQKALVMFRELGLPVVHVRSDMNSASLFRATMRKGALPVDGKAYEIPEQVSPTEGEPVIIKTRASAFFRTPLDVLLRKADVDTVIIAGSTTSGCIRATSIDCHSSGFYTFLLEDGCFDRSPFSHCVSLYELNMKYATVINVEELSQELKTRNPV